MTKREALSPAPPCRAALSPPPFPRLISAALTVLLGLLSSVSANGRFPVSLSTRTFARDCVGRESEKLFVLTFDDGPWEHTEAIMDELSRKGVPGTFFIIGSIFENFPGYTEKYEGLVRRMMREGHVVANHGMDNDEFTLDDVAACHRRIKSITDGHDMNFFRPAQGAYTIEKFDALVEKDYSMVMWNLDVQDWRSDITPEEILARLTYAVRNPTAPARNEGKLALANLGLPRRGSYIMLAHDNNDKMLKTVAGGQTLLGAMIDEIEAAGYRIVTLNECLGVNGKGMGNYCGADFVDAQKCGGQECPSGQNGECPDGSQCYGSVLCPKPEDGSQDVGGQDRPDGDDPWDWSRLENSGPRRSAGMASLALTLLACGLVYLF